MITRTINQFRSGNLGTELKRRLNDGAAYVVARFFDWALDQPAVQKVVTPFVTEVIDNSRIDADQINGLARQIEEEVGDALDKYTPNADDVKDLDDTVEKLVADYIKGGDAVDDVTDGVVEQLIQRLRG